MKKNIKMYVSILILAIFFIQPVFGAEDIKYIVENVAMSSGYRYDSKDDIGNPLDTIKIIDGPSNNYIGVYQVLKNGIFNVKVATSSDILNWKYISDLDTNASYPTITQLSNGGYVVGMQINDGTKIWLRFRYYPDINSLLSGTSSKVFDADHKLAPLNSGAEGAPNIYSAIIYSDISDSVIDIGFNYGNKQAIGTIINFSSWTAVQEDNQVNSALTSLGASATVDRDSILYNGNIYNLIEGQLTQGDWSSFRIFLYNFDTGGASQLSINTHKGSKSFSNPTITQIKGPSGDAMVMTMLIRTEGSALGEPGELIYYTTLTAPPGPGPSSPTPPGPGPTVSSPTPPGPGPTSPTPPGGPSPIPTSPTPTTTTPIPTNTPITPTATTPSSNKASSGSGPTSTTVVPTTTTPVTTTVVSTITSVPTTVVNTIAPKTTISTSTPISTTNISNNSNITNKTVSKEKPNMLLLILGVMVLMVALGIMRFGRRK